MRLYLLLKDRNFGGTCQDREDAILQNVSGVPSKVNSCSFLLKT